MTRTRVDAGALTALREGTSAPVLAVVDHVWSNPDPFLRWPVRALLLCPGRAREKYADYNADQVGRIRAAGLRPDTRSNGPAIMAFLLAGGQRPTREDGRHGWTIHHIYDGRFAAPGSSESTHARADGRYFSEAAGLVAAHPVAESLADEVPYFAWLLRREAHLRFGFDPDGVFGDGATTSPAPKAGP